MLLMISISHDINEIDSLWWMLHHGECLVHTFTMIHCGSRQVGPQRCRGATCSAGGRTEVGRHLGAAGGATRGAAGVGVSWGRREGSLDLMEEDGTEKMTWKKWPESDLTGWKMGKVDQWSWTDFFLGYLMLLKNWFFCWFAGLMGWWNIFDSPFWDREGIWNMWNPPDWLDELSESAPTPSHTPLLAPNIHDIPIVYW